MKWHKLLTQPRTLWVLAILLITLTAVAVLTWRWVEMDRAELYERYSRERQVALELVAREVEKDFKDVAGSLRFMVRLLKAKADVSAEELRPLLLTLLTSSRTYRGIVLVHKEPSPWLWIAEPRRPLPAQGEIHDSVHATIARLSEPGAHPIQISSTLEWEGGSLRVFAMKLPTPWQHVALVVDMVPHLGSLRLAAADPQTRLLVLGPKGIPSPISDPTLRQAAKEAETDSHRGLGQVLALMRDGAQGSRWLRGAEASKLGLGSAGVIVAYHPIRLQGGGHFSVATVTSMTAIKHHERSLFLRLGTGAGTVMLLLLALGGYALTAGHRQAAVEEKLRHAQVEAELHEIAEKTLESIPSGVLLLDAEDRITTANAAFRARLPGPILGQPLSEVLATARPEELDHIWKLINEARRRQAPRSVVTERFSLLGPEGHFQIHAVPLSPASPHANLLLVLDDITELKALQEQLLRAEKLSTIGTLAAGIAHEIGTPLSVVRGRAEYILSKLEPESPQAPGLRVIMEQTDRIVRTVRELLDFSRPSASASVSIHYETVIARCDELLRYELTRRQITLHTDLTPDLPPLSANPDQIQQVLVNLLMNASDASAPGGEIHVSAQMEPAAAGASERSGPGWIRLEIRDHGSGIDPALLHAVFDPFFTTKKRGQGTGLGLFITAHIVRSHGGQIALKSTPGEGTRAILLWPIHESGGDPPSDDTRRADPEKASGSRQSENHPHEAT